MFYYIGITGNACTADIIINGLSVAELKAKNGGSIQYPCNTELVGASNKVEIIISLASIDLTILDRLNCDGTIKRYGVDEFVGPESGTIINQFTLHPKIEELKAKIKADPLSVDLSSEFPVTLTVEFDSTDAPSFAERLNESEPLEDTELLKDWAMDFKQHLINQDIKAMYALYEPKVLDYDIAYPDQKEPDNEQWFANWMKNKIFPQTPFTEFDRDDIVAVKWCEGRIWELKLKDGSPLWTTFGKDDMRSLIQVYVGKDNGEIKIVR